MMEEVDAELRRLGAAIFARPLRAIGLVSKRCGVYGFLPLGTGPLALPETPGQKLYRRVFAWYDARYGDCLKIRLGPGSSVVLLRGDPWRMRFPLIYGTFSVSCIRPGDSAEGLPGRLLNVLDYIEALTPDLAARLSNEECVALCQFFVSTGQTLSDLRDSSGVGFLEHASADLQTSTDHIFSHPAAYGMSKWSSLQAAEKALKSILAVEKLPIPFIHDLSTLSNSLPRPILGLSEATVSDVECPASVRYGNPSVSLEESVAAHHAALKIVRLAIDELMAMKQAAWKAAQRGGGHPSAEGPP